MNPGGEEASPKSYVLEVRSLAAATNAGSMTRPKVGVFNQCVVRMHCYVVIATGKIDVDNVERRPMYLRGSLELVIICFKVRGRASPQLTSKESVLDAVCQQPSLSCVSCLVRGHEPFGAVTLTGIFRTLTRFTSQASQPSSNT